MESGGYTYYMNKLNLIKEILIGDIWDAQADLRITADSLNHLAKLSEDDLKEMREKLWEEAYPEVSPKWEDRTESCGILDMNYDSSLSGGNC